MTLLSRESAMAPGGQRLAASVSGVSLAVLGGKVRGMEEDQVTLVARDEEGAGRSSGSGARQAARCVLGGLLFLGGSLGVAMFFLYIFHQLSL